MSDRDSSSFCSVDDGILNPCEALSQALRDEPYSPESNRLGLILFEIQDTRTTETVKSGVVVRSGDLDGEGILANFCPFCGENISDHFEENRRD